MNIAVIGANGKVGTRVVDEARARGHQVTRVRSGRSRTAAGTDDADVRYADVKDHDELAAAVAGHDAVVVAVHLDMDDPEVHADDPKTHEIMAQSILDGVSESGVRRLVIVGGSGSLRVPPGVMYAFAPDFPSIYYPHASAQTHGWEVIRDADTDLDWSYICPAFRIHLDPGERTGKFRVGGDYLLIDENGLSRISYEDLAVAVLDELESPSHVREMFTVAY